MDQIINFPRFSVLMSLYAKERPKYLIQSLESVFSQTLKPDEIILVLDGPIGNKLRDILDSFTYKHNELRIVPLPMNVGLGKALNEGIKYCSYELVARMDTDDIAQPDRFEKQVQFMSNNIDVDICGTWLQEFEGDLSNKLKIKKVPITHDEITTYIKYRNPLNHPSVIFRKKSVIDAGGYQAFTLFEDYYLWARMMVHNCKFANIPKCLVNFRVTSDMYKRRGGFRYALYNSKFQIKLYKLGIISLTSAIESSIIRGVVSLLPNYIRSLLYNKFLRMNSTSLPTKITSSSNRSPHRGGIINYDIANYKYRLAA